MNSQTKKFGGILAIILIGIFTYFVYLNDQKRDAEMKLSEKEDTLSIIKSHLLQQIGFTEAVINPETSLYSQVGNDSTIASLTTKGKRFCLYIERSQCEDCWERALAFLERSDSVIKYLPAPIIIASGYNRRDFLLMLERHTIKYPVYLIDRPWEIDNLLCRNQPFYFILEKGGRMTSIFYPEGMYELMGDVYLRHVAKYCFPDSIEKNAKADIEILNPEIDLGTVSLRQKCIVELGLRNRGKNKCRIKNVMPTCNCLLVERVPEAILPGEVEMIKVTFLSNNKGTIKREVQVSMEGEEHPYVFKLTGNVI